MARPGIPEVLPILPLGPWVSSGRVFDYSAWPERERFRELDRLCDPGRALQARRSMAARNATKRLPQAEQARRDRRIAELRATGLGTLAIAMREGMKDAAVRQVLQRMRKRGERLDEAA